MRNIVGINFENSNYYSKNINKMSKEVETLNDKISKVIKDI